MPLLLDSGGRCTCISACTLARLRFSIVSISCRSSSPISLIPAGTAAACFAAWCVFWLSSCTHRARRCVLCPNTTPTYIPVPVHTALQAASCVLASTWAPCHTLAWHANPDPVGRWTLSRGMTMELYTHPHAHMPWSPHFLGVDLWQPWQCCLLHSPCYPVACMCVCMRATSGIHIICTTKTHRGAGCGLRGCVCGAGACLRCLFSSDLRLMALRLWAM